MLHQTRIQLIKNVIVMKIVPFAHSISNSPVRVVLGGARDRFQECSRRRGPAANFHRWHIVVQPDNPWVLYRIVPRSISGWTDLVDDLELKSCIPLLASFDVAL